MCEVFPKMFAATVVMDSIVASQENPGQSDNAMMVDTAVSGTVAAMNFIASRYVEDDE